MFVGISPLADNEALPLIRRIYRGRRSSSYFDPVIDVPCNPPRRRWNWTYTTKSCGKIARGRSRGSKTRNTDRTLEYSVTTIRIRDDTSKNSVFHEIKQKRVKQNNGMFNVKVSHYQQLSSYVRLKKNPQKLHTFILYMLIYIAYYHSLIVWQKDKIFDYRDMHAKESYLQVCTGDEIRTYFEFFFLAKEEISLRRGYFLQVIRFFVKTFFTATIVMIRLTVARSRNDSARLSLRKTISPVYSVMYSLNSKPFHKRLRFTVGLYVDGL